MKAVSSFALGLALVLGGVTAGAVAPAVAKEKPAKAKEFKLGTKLREALAPIQKALEANNIEAAKAALSAAEAVATTGDEKFVVGQFYVQTGGKANDRAMQGKGIDMMIESGSAPADMVGALYQNQGSIAYQNKDFAKAEAAFTKLVEVNPADSSNLISLGELQYRNGKAELALQTIGRAIAAKEAAGAPADQPWYQRGLSIAADKKLTPEIIRFGRMLVKAYPTAQNWRDSTELYLQQVKLDPQTSLDLFRLRFDTKSLMGERDWYEYAETANGRGLPGETKTVLDAGLASGMLPKDSRAIAELKADAVSRVSADQASLTGAEARAKSGADGKAAKGTADAWLGYGNNTKAIELYRLAASKGNVDLNELNTRLGIALLRSGDKAGALAAFKQVTGARADVAGYWIILASM